MSSTKGAAVDDFVRRSSTIRAVATANSDFYITDLDGLIKVSPPYLNATRIFPNLVGGLAMTVTNFRVLSNDMIVATLKFSSDNHTEIRFAVALTQIIKIPWSLELTFRLFII